MIEITEEEVRVFVLALRDAIALQTAEIEHREAKGHATSIELSHGLLEQYKNLANMLRDRMHQHGK